MCEDIVGDALTLLVSNQQRGAIDVSAIKAPSFAARRTSALQDIAIATGAQYVEKDGGRCACACAAAAATTPTNQRSNTPTPPR